MSGTDGRIRVCALTGSLHDLALARLADRVLSAAGVESQQPDADWLVA